MAEVRESGGTAGGVDVTALVAYRSPIDDNWRWADFEPRPGDIFVCTPPKCGTTWMQTIVTTLIFDGRDLPPSVLGGDRMHPTVAFGGDGPQLADREPGQPASVLEVSPWLEMRIFPVDDVLNLLRQQDHRRCIKTHTPADGIPWFDDARYIVVGRDGRDAFMSFLNHVRSMRPEQTMALAMSAMEEGIDIGEPPPIDDLHEFYDYWIANAPFFHFIDTYWQRRRQDNVLFVHFNDLKADLEGQMRRVADFLGIEAEESRWPHLVERCTFASMKARPAEIGPFELLFEGGADSFLYKGTNDRWRDVLTDDELKAYAARSEEVLAPEALAWLAGD